MLNIKIHVDHFSNLMDKIVGHSFGPSWLPIHRQAGFIGDEKSLGPGIPMLDQQKLMVGQHWHPTLARQRQAGLKVS